MHDSGRMAVFMQKNRRTCSTSARVSRRGWLAVWSFLAAGFWCQFATASDGFYAAVALERSLAQVDYEKSVGYDSPISVVTAGDRARDSVDAFKGASGYRWPVSSRLYVAGEIEATYAVNGKTRGYLTGTGDGGADVWPGTWTLRQRAGAGVSARLGFVPAALEFLGSGRSLYLFAGTRWIDAEFEAAHINPRLGIAGSRRADRTLNPWLAGVGMEFVKHGHRFDLRLSYAVDDVDFHVGTGAAGSPRLGYTFEVREWRLSLGYIVLL